MSLERGFVSIYSILTKMILPPHKGIDVGNALPIWKQLGFSGRGKFLQHVMNIGSPVMVKNALRMLSNFVVESPANLRICVFPQSLNQIENLFHSYGVPLKQVRDEEGLKILEIEPMTDAMRLAAETFNNAMKLSFTISKILEVNAIAANWLTYYERRRVQTLYDTQQHNMKRKAEELDLLEELRKKSRRESDLKIMKCNQMNNVCVYQPLDMEDWCEHDSDMYYGPDVLARCFDAIELLRHFESNLTMSKYGNPYPQYPNDPFSRQTFTLQELNEILRIANSSTVVDVARVAPIFISFLAWLSEHPEFDSQPFNVKSRMMVIDDVLKKNIQLGGYLLFNNLLM
jgi:hypothetical protein